MKNFFLPLLMIISFGCSNNTSKGQDEKKADSTSKKTETETSRPQVLDTAKYDRLMTFIANGDTTGKWPVKHAYPLPGAILPFNRIVAYYGNLQSKKMGALGKWPKDTMIHNLLAEIDKWNKLDTVIKSIPALHYIAVTAQGAAGKDGKWRARMSTRFIDTVLSWANEINAQVFIDVQLGLSTVEAEVPLFEKYLKLPNVHFGIDPEFAMNAKGGARPGSVIGSLDAKEINWVGDYLADIVRKNNLPPKILMVHRFTKGMVTNANQIKLHPELQIVMDMDGWGPPDLKKGSYQDWIRNEPVQFTGFKLFYVNDVVKSGQKEMMKYEDVLNLRPRPIYIQYQ